MADGHLDRLVVRSILAAQPGYRHHWFGDRDSTGGNSARSNHQRLEVGPGNHGWLVDSGLDLAVPQPSGTDFVNGVLIGICLGTAQWLILRTEIYGAGWWIVMNIVAWTTALAYLSGIVLNGVMAGLITGTALALLLRNRKTPPPARNSPYLR